MRHLRIYDYSDIVPRTQRKRSYPKLTNKGKKTAHLPNKVVHRGKPFKKCRFARPPDMQKEIHEDELAHELIDRECDHKWNLEAHHGDEFEQHYYLFT